MCDSLSSCMTVLMMVTMLSSMERELVGSELAKKLGRPLTEWDWQVYYQEKASKEQQTSLSNKWQPISWEGILAPLRQMIKDFETIHNFVWGAGVDKL